MPETRRLEAGAKPDRCGWLRARRPGFIPWLAILALIPGQAVFAVVLPSSYTITESAGEYRFYSGEQHFLSLIRGNGIFDFRPHPGVDENGWGSSWYAQPFLPGAVLAHTVVESVSAGADGIDVIASGKVSSGTASTYGDWSMQIRFAYDPAAKVSSGTGSYSITLPATLAGVNLDLNLYKIASNFLHDVPRLVTAGIGDTGDMTYAEVCRSGTCVTWNQIADPGYYPGEISDQLSADVHGCLNEVDTEAQGFSPIMLAYKPGLKVSLLSDTPGEQMAFGAAYTTGGISVCSGIDVGKSFCDDNIGITPLIKKISPQTAFHFDVTFESEALAESSVANRPSTIAVAGVGSSSITLAWGTGYNAAGTRYRAEISTDGFSSVNASSVTRNASAVFSGLWPNTTYALKVESINIAEQATTSDPTISTRTRGAAPTGISTAAVHATSATIVWGLNGNPSTTLAELERSTDLASYAQVASSRTVSFTDTGLVTCTTYYFRARNLYDDGVATAYDGPVQFTTEASTPSSASNLQAWPLPGNRVALSWAPSPSGGVVSYRLYFDAGTGTVDYGAPLAVFTSTETGYTTGVLVSSAAYRFALRATNLCGFEEKNTHLVAASPALASWTGVRAAITEPQGGKRIKGNSVTVMGELVSGDVAQLKEVRFQYKASNSATWLDITPANALNHPNPDTDAPYYLHWDVSALAAGSYDVRAVATDSQDNADAAPLSVTVLVAAAGAAEYDINENVSGAIVTKEQRIYNSVGNTVRAAEDGGRRVTTVDIPAGALDAAEMTVSVTNTPAAAPPTGSGLESAGVVTEIVLSGSQTQLAGGKTAVVELGYADDDGDDIVDGTGIWAGRLRMYSAATVAGPWVWGASAALDLTNKKVRGTTSHLSFFGLFGAASAVQNAVRVYPNPYMPNSGNADKGGGALSGITFDNLPDGATIKIYTILGSLVAELSGPVGGVLRWDAKNRAGQDAASDGYLALISAPGSGSVVKTLLIVR